jgi:hypothetical protein
MLTAYQERLKMYWRKSFAEKNISMEGSKRKLLPDERSVWDDYLDLAGLSMVHGKICCFKNVGYTQEQLSILLNCPVELISRAESRFVNFGMIELNGNRVIHIQNWKLYQSEYDRQKPYRNVTLKGYNKRLQGKVTDTSNSKSYSMRSIEGRSNKNKTTENKHKSALLEQVYKDGFNIYALINKAKKQSNMAQDYPQEVIDAICKSYITNKATIKNQWGWFKKALYNESCRYFAKLNIKEAETFKQQSDFTTIGQVIASIQKNQNRGA